MTDRLLRRPEVEAMIGLSTASIYRLMRAGRFPEPVRVGARAVRWRLSALERFLADCPTASGERTEGTPHDR